MNICAEVPGDREEDYVTQAEDIVRFSGGRTLEFSPKGQAYHTSTRDCVVSLCPSCSWPRRTYLILHSKHLLRF